ncbi:glycosyl transferase [Candidatus Tenderia electrophaga]|jgi:phosphatidylinositol alpha-1,6-mannosyltransferase|uniref:Glycosyl transferase n=1 Tax=Candidatus Tenderia electrophaga TaxID=1748243 RepID=A0A0S2TG22_9GAMM|nr:glycosyl transferase [Candidatus Tenderia electrophaga]
MNKNSFPCLLLTEIFLPTSGGTAVLFDGDFRELGGKEVHIVTAAVPGAHEFDQTHPNTIHRLGLKRHAWLRPESALMYIKLFSRSLGIALTRPINAVFAGRALPEGITAWAVARLTRRPVIIYAHGEELTGWGRGKKFKAMCFALRHADWVIANSDFTHDTLATLIKVNPEKIVTLYPTADEVRFRPDLPYEDLRQDIGISEQQKLILSVGRLQRRKGFDNVIRSLPELLANGIDVHYALIGIGEDHDYLIELAAEYGVAERIHFLGHVSYEDLPRWYNACDVFAMPNRDIDGDTEGFGLVYLEAAASCKPSITGNSGGTGSAVAHGETGLRVNGDSVDEIAAALISYLIDPALAASTGTKGRDRVLEKFTQERRAQNLRRLIGASSP